MVAIGIARGHGQPRPPTTLHKPTWPSGATEAADWTEAEAGIAATEAAEAKTGATAERAGEVADQDTEMTTSGTVPPMML
jgi:hypothetical protein